MKAQDRNERTNFTLQMKQLFQNNEDLNQLQYNLESLQSPENNCVNIAYILEKCYPKQEIYIPENTHLDIFSFFSAAILGIISVAIKEKRYLLVKSAKLAYDAQFKYTIQHYYSENDLEMLEVIDDYFQEILLKIFKEREL